MPYYKAVGHIDDSLSPEDVAREYRRRYGLAAYHRRRAEIIAALGGQCSVCQARDCELTMVRKKGSPKFHVGAMVTMSARRRAKLMRHVTLMCTEHAAQALYRKDQLKHGAYWAAYRRKCQCEECAEFRANRALERREDRRRARGEEVDV